MAPGRNAEAVNGLDEWTKPAFLRRVRIRGYKSIAFCDVPLQPLTILVGRNAAGKSNFLDALAFLCDVVDSGATAAMKRHGGWSSIACRELNSPTIEIEIEAAFTCGHPRAKISDRNGPSVTRPPEMGPMPDLTGRVFSATYGIEITAGVHAPPTISRETLEITDETHRLNGGFEVHNGIVSRWRSKPDLTDPLSLPHSRELQTARRPDLPLLSIIGAQPFVELGGKLGLMGFYNFSPNAIRDLQKPNPGWMLAKDGSNLASAIRGLEEINEESVARIRDYLILIAKEVEDFEAVRYGEYETVRFWLQGGSSDSPLEFDAADMSDGTLRALAALMAAFQIVLPVGYPGVIGIEEPETALHPAAVQVLVDALDDATQRTQILLTTHSVDLLAGRNITPGEVLVVRNRGGLTEIAPVDAASREIVQKELYTLAELQRMDHLEPDAADIARQTQAMTASQEK